MAALELWGGHECTVVRLGDRYRDQTLLGGHQDRRADLERLADLGLTALRYPILWERVRPTFDQPDWGWTDERLGDISRLGMRPIAGLLHHGSGPPSTHLLDDGFAAAFADYAEAVAERYPWIGEWTPINEPLTTARFSALYGHWYPHAADETAFWTALLNQIDAIRLAMRRIRKVRSDAQLVQTEDLGRTYATRALAHQAEFDNNRRWMTWDLLEGRVTPGHAHWDRLNALGFADRLKSIADAPCAPDVVGINHYLTSDRFLDHRIADYPADRIGGNEFMAFADVEAIRVVQPAPGGLEGVLTEAWARYGRPLAVTECHLACTREEQVRWLREAWTCAEDLRQRDVDVRAVTAWCLLGAHDWDSLLTRDDGRYEPGAFDVRADAPRPTAIAAELKRLAGRSTAPPHPATQGPGWWRRDIRLQYRPVFRSGDSPEPRPAWRTDTPAARPLLIVGATGTLGRALARACEWRGIDYRLTARTELSLGDDAQISATLDRIAPWAVINAAGWVRVDDAEGDPRTCLDANADGALRLARRCGERGLPMVGFSSDLVFDGQRDRPYVESDAVRPLNVYGVSKARAEAEILALGGAALMVRTAAFFSPYDTYNFASDVARTLVDGRRFEAAADLIISPTYVPDLVDAVLDLLIDGETGLRHLANDGALTWADFARRIATALDLDPQQIVDRPAAHFGWRAPRPAYAALGTERGAVMPSLDDAAARYAIAMRQMAFAETPTSAQAQAPARSRAVSEAR